MTTPQQVLDMARSQIGTRENPPGTNRQPYGKWYSFDGVAWCAIFVSWCFAHAGLPEVRYSYCPVALSRFQSGAWGTWKGRANPQPGDIVLYGYPWGSTGPGGAHTGIVERVAGDTVITIEGNTSSGTRGSQANGDGVWRRQRRIGGWLYGFGTPHYSGTSNPPKEVEDMNVEELVSVLRSEGISGGGDRRRMNPLGQGQIIVRPEDGTGRCYLVDGITRRWVRSPSDLRTLRFLRTAAGLDAEVHPISAESIDSYGVLAGPDGLGPS